MFNNITLSKFKEELEQKFHENSMEVTVQFHRIPTVRLEDIVIVAIQDSVPSPDARALGYFELYKDKQGNVYWDTAKNTPNETQDLCFSRAKPIN